MSEMFDEKNHPFTICGCAWHVENKCGDESLITWICWL